MAKTLKLWLDAGHGGKDPGACNGKRSEANDVLKLTLSVGKKLAASYSNVKVGYSRTNDIYESPRTKAAQANKWGADYFISFHRNSASASAKGYETLVSSNTGIKKKMSSAFNSKMKSIGFVNRGTKVRTNLAVLNRTNMPAWLLEVGFISNKTDNAIFDSKYAEIVNGIVDVIASSLGLIKKKNGTVTQTSTADAVPKKEGTKFKEGAYNKTVKVAKECAVRTGRAKTYKKIGALKAGEKIKVLYILKNDAGNLWGSIDYGDGIGYICLEKCRAV